MKYITKNAQETQKLGEEFAQQLKGRVIIALYGDLGSGKTTFTQGIARGLGITKRLISPTFVIIRMYSIDESKFGINTFYHIDLYRLTKKEDAAHLGIQEILENQSAVVVIEWAEKLEDLLAGKRWDIKFIYKDLEQREIIIKKRTSS